MIEEHQNQRASLESRLVKIALRHGLRTDNCQLVSTGQTRLTSISLFANDTDTFVALDDLADTWEDSP
jgi:hypothetical protein